jgi:hypothetical protein
LIWLALLIQFAAAYGPARIIAHHSALTAKRSLTLALAPVIATGGVSLVMFWLGLLRIPFNPVTTAILYGLLLLPGWWLAWRADTLRFSLSVVGWGRRLGLLLLAGICGAALLNAALWPFYRADALGIYVPFAEALAATKSLVPITPTRNLYELYPQLMSFNYAHLYAVAGWNTPYPARVLNALLGLAVFPATYVLAREMFPYWLLAAPFAVGLLALTPDVANWSHAGYVDLPMATAYTLGAAFAVATVREGRHVDALLTGICFGLAAWIKNAALLSVGLVFTFGLANLILGQLRLNHILLASTMVAIVAGPWYLRNLLLAGMLTPDTVWVDQAQQTLAEVFILISRPQNYGLLGLLMTIAVGWALIRRSGWVLLWWSLPYYGFWVLFASYDPRFVLLFLPFLAALGGAMLAEGWAWLDGRRWQPPIRLAGWVLVVALAGGVMWNTLEYKRALLDNPLLTHAQKVEIVRTE